MSAKQMPKQHSLCIAVLSLNEASTITNCLHSAQFADQLLVIDAGSTDSTARSPGAAKTSPTTSARNGPPGGT
jgi:glycosyltransferase involved in cell wall biosynthesis